MKYTLTDLDASSASPYRQITAQAANDNGARECAEEYAAYTGGRIQVEDEDGTVIFEEIV